jgi:hypothetical protein
MLRDNVEDSSIRNHSVLTCNYTARGNYARVCWLYPVAAHLSD